MRQLVLLASTVRPFFIDNTARGGFGSNGGGGGSHAGAHAGEAGVRFSW